MRLVRLSTTGRKFLAFFSAVQRAFFPTCFFVEGTGHKEIKPSSFLMWAINLLWMMMYCVDHFTTISPVDFRLHEYPLPLHVGGLLRITS